eukprot:gnl/TRDRNA2_/TRDRNA2_195481_c0_seq1.p1 gnl/TRDRNA2_/TRDRNA2_195481_c0~~gnl/TRDRNA2_/TRDRNA2_195481_c0_seq1.p1  ORF type:complete len:173 (-),score=35.23 gnl/TRDRNA2_/TRDRNA2_195481_c0_seq1:101-619(-)
MSGTPTRGPGSSQDATPNHRFGKPLRSKGLLPVIGVGGVFYFVTGIASFSTIGLICIGAGVGYGVGTWIADKFSKDEQLQRGAGTSREQMPWAVQVALQQWWEFVASKTGGGRQPSPAEVDRLWAEFAQQQPTHATNVRVVLQPHLSARSFAGGGTRPPGTGVTLVPQATEV